MGCSDDVARFRADDAPVVVAASFACPHCLRVDCDAVLTPAHEQGDVACRCATCAARWSVGVDAEQALRLTLGAPGAGVGYRVALRVAARRDAPRTR